MAMRLLAAGHDLHVWNRSPEKTRSLAQAGATVHTSPADAARKARMIITMLTDGKAVGDVLFDQPTLAAIDKDAIVIDMSSIRPREACDHERRLAEAGIFHLDAPVSGGTKGAQAGTLAIMAGGQPQIFKEAEPVFAPMGRARLVGPSGAGQRAKLANQAIVAATIGIVAEATLLVRAGGGDLSAFRDALKGGFADSTILQLHGQRMENGDYTPGGPSAIQLKDLDNILAEAADLGIDLPMAHVLRSRFHRLVHELGKGDLDHAALFVELLDLNGMAQD